MTVKNNCKGGNISKEGLVVLLCTNMDGDFETPLIIDKDQSPSCFKGININSFKVDWRSNKKVCMTGK